MDAAEAPKRPMRYPYTYSAKIAQFPLKFYLQNNQFWKYFGFGLICTVPIFYKIHKLANSPENIRRAAEMKIKEEAELHGH